MRLGVPAFFLPAILGALLLNACYQQPALSPQRPLRCTTSKTADECPKGYACQGGLCGPTSCEHASDCPGGLLCTNRGCVLAGDGGQPDAFQIPNGRDGEAPEAAIIDGPPAPDAPAAAVDGGQD